MFSSSVWTGFSVESHTHNDNDKDAESLSDQLFLTDED